VVSDPFSDILKLTNAESVVSGGFAAGGRWALRFPDMDKISFSALVKGALWLTLAGEPQPVRVEAGDLLLLAPRRSFILASDLDVAPVDAVVAFAENVNGMAQVGEGEDCVQIGGFIRLDPASGPLLVGVLPPLIHVQAASPHATVIRWLVDQLIRERSSDLPGAALASKHLAQLMFVQILRAHLETSAPLAAGWLRAAGDKRIAPALRLMHADPARAWQLEELARAAAMSRTTFAVHFKSAAGVAPLTYLTEWRMRLAERALREENVPVAALARSLGYTSESAFSNAYKRVTGSAPKRYRTAIRSAAG